MKVTWLAQAGLLFENGKTVIMVDPYFSDSVGKINPAKKRRIEADDSFLDKDPDFVLITHDHLDHLDPETIEAIIAKSKKAITFIAPENAYNKLVKCGGEHNYVMLNPHSVWSESGITFYAVRAEHSDRTAAGFIIDDGEKTYYVSGDTLYNYDVIDEVLELVEEGVDFAFLPINGKGNNMNAKDAADFAYEIGAKKAIPIHYGLFDSLDPESFDFDDTLILTPFVPTELSSDED
jgi:L-ascorbate 6-phosphate lactonase